jgi:hypothetical protein
VFFCSEHGEIVNSGRTYKPGLQIGEWQPRAIGGNGAIGVNGSAREVGATGVVGGLGWVV